jgi:hypothetical protein
MAAPNAMTTQTYSFTIKADTTAPMISNRIPAAGAVGVDPTALISFQLTDSETGVNQATIVMKVNGVTVAPTITGNKNEFTVTYTPIVPFVNGSSVTISVSASDLAQ